jgi:hypothetical protein
MNAIQIQKLINTIGEFNSNLNLEDLFENGEEILEYEKIKIKTSKEELDHKLNVQLKENSDAKLLQSLSAEINKLSIALQEQYHKYRIKLSESNNSNPIYNKSIPIVCNLIDFKLDSLSILENDLDLIIENFEHRISTDFGSVQDKPTLSVQNQELGTEGKATFNLGKKESLMFLYILEQSDLLMFESDEQRRKFIEANFCFTEMRDNSDKGKSLPMRDISSDISKLGAKHLSEPNNKTLDKLLNKLNDSIHLFEFKS